MKHDQISNSSNFKEHEIETKQNDLHSSQYIYILVRIGCACVQHVVHSFRNTDVNIEKFIIPVPI